MKIKLGQFYTVRTNYYLYHEQEKMFFHAQFSGGPSNIHRECLDASWTDASKTVVGKNLDHVKKTIALSCEFWERKISILREVLDEVLTELSQPNPKGIGQLNYRRDFLTEEIDRFNEYLMMIKSCVIIKDVQKIDNEISTV